MCPGGLANNVARSILIFIRKTKDPALLAEGFEMTKQDLFDYPI